LRGPERHRGVVALRSTLRDRRRDRRRRPRVAGPLRPHAAAAARGRLPDARAPSRRGSRDGLVGPGREGPAVTAKTHGLAARPGKPEAPGRLPGVGATMASGRFTAVAGGADPDAATL